MIKKIIIFVLIVAILVGCAPASQPKKIETATTVSHTYRYIDTEAGVVCWIWALGYAGGIFCMPISQTKLELSDYIGK